MNHLTATTVHTTAGRRLLAATAAVVAISGLALGAATRSDGENARSITSAVGPAPSTTLLATPVPAVADAPPASPATPVTTREPVVTPRAPATTAVPKPAAGPERSRPAGMSYSPETVWPETLAELDRLQAAADQGHQPWRNDPVGVARAYLLDRGLPAVGMAPFRATADGAGSVDYTVAGMGGRVDLQRLRNGSVWYVAGSRSATFPGVHVQRRSGSLAVTVQAGADGTMTARLKRPGGEWGVEQSRQAFTGGTRSISLEHAASGELIVQLRLTGDGRAGVAEIHIGPGTDAMSYSALDSESRLQVDGLGPVRIGMGLEEARAASGLPMVYQEAPDCVGFQTDGPPAGLGFTSAAGNHRLDLITVSEPSIATLSGIRVGSTLAEVRRAYGERAQGTLHDGWGKLVVRPDNTSLSHVALGLLFSEGKVAGMWAGLRVLVQADEICA